MSTFVIGDIHGAYEALLQCFRKANFDYAEDRLICLGDVCDRRPMVKKCVDELLKVEKLVLIRGNHDQWALEWMESGEAEENWLRQGGEETVQSYANGVPESHVSFFKNSTYYHEENNCLFVHGGVDHRIPVNVQDPRSFLWDRGLVSYAIENKDKNLQLGPKNYPQNLDNKYN